MYLLEHFLASFILASTLLYLGYLLTSTTPYSVEGGGTSALRWLSYCAVLGLVWLLHLAMDGLI